MLKLSLVLSWRTLLKAALAIPTVIITAQFAFIMLMANHLAIVALNGLLVEAIYCQVVGLTTLFTVVLFIWFGLFIRSDKRKALSVIFSILVADRYLLSHELSTCKWIVSFSVSGTTSWFVSSSPSGEQGVSICTSPCSSGGVSVALGDLAWTRYTGFLPPLLRMWGRGSSLWTRSGTRVLARAGLWGISVDILSLAWGGLERGGISVTATSFDSFFATTTASLKAVIVDSKSNDSIGWAASFPPARITTRP